MTVKFVTHAFQTSDVTVMGNVEDAVTVRGKKISRIGAVEGQEQENPAAIHINFEKVDKLDDMVVLTLGITDALELGLQLVAMGIEDQPSPGVDEIRDRLSQLIAELDRTLQVSH